ncbi:MAG: DNA/RNA nuclease SfsA [Candidatus Adiutrix sp.]|jgi:sugar fermentation stimulation protein A|nr:DNA/RNA nuclease SfsA [Candidatus Adiutrix sp.]
MPVDSSGYLAPAPGGGLSWGPLIRGRLIRRYKRFLADVELDGGWPGTAHTPNTGRMLGCSEPGRPVWLSRHEGGGRKYPLTLEMIQMPTALVGVNTMVPNRLAALAAAAGLLAETRGPVQVAREVTVGRSRLDLRLTDARGGIIMVEVKNCTLAENGAAFFPDAVTERGTRHLDELAALAASGLRAALFILVQRADADHFRPADHIDPEWGRRLRTAVARGVEVWAYRADLSLEKISLGDPLPVLLKP